MKLDGKTAIITGGASGLGEAAVSRFLEEGANVVIADIQEGSSTKVIEKYGKTRAIYVKTDVSNVESLENLFKQAVTSFKTVDILVNCAGILHAGNILSKKCGPKEFQRAININVFGTFYATKLAAKIMVNQQPDSQTGERGVIINVSSIAGTDGQKGQTIYSATKGAVSGMTLPLARDLGEFKVRVVTVAPGVFVTPMAGGWNQDTMDAFSRFSALKEMGKPDQFSDFCYAIVKNSYLSGVTLRLDGGMLLPNL